MARRLVGPGVIACTLVISGCGGEDGAVVGTSTSTSASTSTSTTSSTTAPATAATSEPERVATSWTLDPAFPVSDADTSVHLLLSPRECSADIEREPLPADVEFVDGEVHITTYLRAVDEPNGECSFPTYPTVVDLGTSIDGRPLVDGACLTGGSRAGPNPSEWCVVRP